MLSGTFCLFLTSLGMQSLNKFISGRGWLPLILVSHRTVVGLSCSYCEVHLKRATPFLQCAIQITYLLLLQSLLKSPQNATLPLIGNALLIGLPMMLHACQICHIPVYDPSFLKSKISLS